MQRFWVVSDSFLVAYITLTWYIHDTQEAKYAITVERWVTSMKRSMTAMLWSGWSSLGRRLEMTTWNRHGGYIACPASARRRHKAADRKCSTLTSVWVYEVSRRPSGFHWTNDIPLAAFKFTSVYTECCIVLAFTAGCGLSVLIEWTSCV